MDLKQRLAQLDRITQRQKPEVTADPVRRTWDAKSALVSLGLCERETANGSVWCADHVDEVAPVAGSFPDMSGLFTREPNGRPQSDHILLMDTETTGLAGGTGTLIFQVGVSWWSDEKLITRQYFLPGPADETAMLADLAILAQKFSTIVTFNGASFDLPLLRTRALLNRLPDPFAELISWDLLVPARRMWSQLLPDCRQGTIERRVCQIKRGAGDIDGARIPQTWFDFLASGQSGELANVLTHNHRDMVGMARILGVLRRIGDWLTEPAGVAEGLPEAAGWRGLTGWWALGKVFERKSDVVRAAQCFERACSEGWEELLGDEKRIRFRRDAVRNLKRQQRWPLVADLLDDGLAEGFDSERLHREAAILYEHRLVDLPRAMKHAVACGEEKRQSRLQAKIARCAERKSEVMIEAVDT